MWKQKLVKQYAVYVNGRLLSKHRTKRAAYTKAASYIRKYPENCIVTVEDESYFDCVNV